MGSRGSLLALSVLAAALAVGLLVDDPSPPPRSSTRVLPEFDPVRVDRLSWTRPGQPDVVVALGEAGPRVIRPVDAPADRDAVAAALAALERLTYHRVGTPADAGPVRVSVRAGSARVAVGAALPQLGRTWVVAGGRAYLVDDDAVRALDVALEDLRERRALDFTPEDVVAFELHGDAGDLSLSGRPLQVHLERGGRARADVDRVRAALDALASARIDRFVDGVDDAQVPPGLVVRVHAAGPAQQIAVRGPCPGSPSLVLADTEAGRGCLPDAALAPARALLASGPMALVDRRLFRGKPDAVAIGDVRLERRGAIWRFSDGRLADADAVREWLAAVRSIEATDVAPGGAGGGVRVDLGGEVVDVDLRRRIARRAGEPVALALPTVAPFRATAVDFYDRGVWIEEPATLRAIRRAGRSVDRGATGDWPAARDAEAVRAVRDGAARLRAVRFTRARPRAPVDVELEFDPPPGASAPVVHTLAVGRNCVATSPDAPAPFELSPALCAALLAPW